MEQCFHGGQFWDAVGAEFDDLSRARNVINADVLDAWFPPSPQVIEALSSHPEWWMRTSPPTHAEGLEKVIADVRGVKPTNVLAGPGSSSLIYLVWQNWLAQGLGEKALILEPTYGEYDHICRHCDVAVQRFTLDPANGFAFDPEKWLRQVIDENVDIAVLVNPNNPTGTTISVENLLREYPKGKALWIDEAYIGYSDSESAERIAAEHPFVFVLKSLSKEYALSGLRAAYLVAHENRITELKSSAPPWWVSLPAQMAAVAALRSGEYYQARIEETLSLRQRFETRLAALGLKVSASACNWVLIELPESLSAAKFTSALADQNIFVRNAGLTAPSLGDRYIRIAVKPEDEQNLICEKLAVAFAQS